MIFRQNHDYCFSFNFFLANPIKFRFFKVFKRSLKSGKLDVFKNGVLKDIFRYIESNLRLSPRLGGIQPTPKHFNHFVLRLARNNAIGFPEGHIIPQNIIDNAFSVNLFSTAGSNNFSWSIFFFNMQVFIISFLVLVALWLSIIITIIKYYRINKAAAWLQLPYLLWVTFAGYLNFAIILLN